jgi:hypothetical protein
MMSGYDSYGATELGLMVLADFYSKDLGRFFTKSGADLLGMSGAFCKNSLLLPVFLIKSKVS